MMGGGRMNEGTENDPETVDTVELVGARIIVKHYRRSLGMEGSMSEVETPPPHNPDTPPGPVASNTHTHIYVPYILQNYVE